MADFTVSGFNTYTIQYQIPDDEPTAPPISVSVTVLSAGKKLSNGEVNALGQFVKDNSIAIKDAIAALP